MAGNTKKRKFIIALSILGVLLVAIGTVSLIRLLKPADADPYTMREDTSQTQSTENETKKPNSSDKTSEADSKQKDTPAVSESGVSLDPANVGTIDIQPMKLVVSYVRGIGGFEFEVLRTPNGSQYVEFRSADLAGTKCTNDNGAFASILEDPTAGEGTTIDKRTTIGSATYGLSLAAANCTSDATKLEAYQKSFSDAFSLLKKAE